MITSLSLNHAVANSAYLFSKNDIGYSNLKNYLIKLKIANSQIYLNFLLLAYYIEMNYELKFI